jgi:hypothetical protein
LVGKNRVVHDECDEVVECFQLDPNFATKAIGTINPPIFKQVKLGGF